MASISPSRPVGCREPAWEIARLFPNQGFWSEEDYLSLRGNYLVEYSEGRIDVLPIPAQSHQNIVAFLYEAILLYVRAGDLGKVLFAPLRVRLGAGKFREPDIAFMRKEHSSRRRDEYWEGADWVIEVVSDDDRRRDTEKKRLEYAQAGIPEYWIVDPAKSEILVLTLQGAEYLEAGRYGVSQPADSETVTGFAIDTRAVFDAAKQ